MARGLGGRVEKGLATGTEEAGMGTPKASWQGGRPASETLPLILCSVEDVTQESCQRVSHFILSSRFYTQETMLQVYIQSALRVPAAQFYPLSSS